MEIITTNIAVDTALTPTTLVRTGVRHVAPRHAQASTPQVGLAGAVAAAGWQPDGSDLTRFVDDCDLVTGFGYVHAVDRSQMKNNSIEFQIRLGPPSCSPPV